MFFQTKHLLDISPEVYIAMESNYPVVALESTIITHGKEIDSINFRNGIPYQCGDSFGGGTNHKR